MIMWRRCIKQLLMIQSRTHFSTHLKHTSPEEKLFRQIRAKIKATGPITVADYMKEVLVNPSAGYYMNRDVLGSQGDFITSPEISQMFGELLAVWCLHEWVKLGSPSPFQIVELGPGRGTLLEDMLRVLSRYSELKRAMSLHLVEISPKLQEIQEQKLCGAPCPRDALCADSIFAKKNVSTGGIPICWYYRLQDVPRGFTCYIAHEFFDALPVHKFQKTPEGWREVLIGLEPKTDNQLCYVLARGYTPASKTLISAKETRDHIELSAEAAVLLEHLTTRLDDDGGFALIADYGHEGTKTDTFRAFRSHKLVDPLVNPGSADLTADVDFAFVKKQVQDKALVFGPITQATFLSNMAIHVRLEKLLATCKPEDCEALISGYNMLTSPEKMGERFKFMALYPMAFGEYLQKFPPAGFIRAAPI